MSVARRRSDRSRPVAALERLVSALGISLTLFTLTYAVSLVFGWPSFLEPIVTEPRWVKRDELYVITFFGMGVALYYLEYARSRYAGVDDEFAAAGSAARERSADASGALDRARRTFDRLDPVVAVALAVAAIAATAYVYANFGRLEDDAFIVGYTTTDHLVGAVLIGLAIDATRRAFGTVIAVVAALAILYAHSAVGTRLFGVFRHTGMSWEQIAENGAIGISGVYDSTLMGIGSTWVAIFIMFAGIAKAYGLMDFVREVGQELGASLRTGVVQIAVISSMIMGSITGSAAANTATTGSFTIPMIKDQGVRDDVAASIEAVASAGGQMLPPVMGVAAFLMADIIGVPYVTIVKAGVIPAALFYFGVCLAVHFTVLKFGWTSRDLSPFDWRLLLGGAHFAVPMGVLLVTLVYLQYTPFTAGLYTIVAIVATMFVRNVVLVFLWNTVGVKIWNAVVVTVWNAAGVKVWDAIAGGTTANAGSDAGDDRRGRANLLDEASPATDVHPDVVATCKQTIRGLERGGVEMAPLVGVLAAMGVIVKLLEGTGLTARVATAVIGMSDVTVLGIGGGLLLVLLLAMATSILFGLGMPTPAAYILVATLVARPVTELGTPDITAHMFVFYFAMLSAITPPVAISVAIGSRIAGASFMRSCVQSLRLGAPGFIIPYAFVANNSLIYWSAETLVAFPLVLAGTVGLIVATVGFDGARPLSYPVRGLYVLAALCAMFGSSVHVGVQVFAAVAIVAVLLHARFVVGYDRPVDAESGVEPSTVD
ncbi:TRAP transporter permease [Halosolutus gelatinilyticus]|uniref:TRAP transporter permease n=1 Tax=Halosolutus gelatinilyticus TaxID=2931975 RepID=UPI001FF44B5E|nr:TRAP transporter fused permease subunit [Halosolutus gelatinilyticus]